MRKIFIDTNVWLRFLVADQKEKYEACRKLIELVEEGKIRTYTSTIVFLELIYTLASFYKIKQGQIMADIKDILSGRNLTLIEKTDFRKSLALYEKHKIKLADCLISTQLPKAVALCTYDADFKKIKNIISLTPDEVLQNTNMT